MPSSLMVVISKGFGIVIQFVAAIGVSTLVAYFAAQSFGRSSRQSRQAIFSIVLIIGIIVAAVFMQYRVRHLSA